MTREHISGRPASMQGDQLGGWSGLPMRNDVGLRKDGWEWHDKTWLDSGCVLKVEFVGSWQISCTKWWKEKGQECCISRSTGGRQRQHLGWRGRGATRGSVLKPLALDWLLEIQMETAGRPGVSVAWRLTQASLADGGSQPRAWVQGQRGLCWQRSEDWHVDQSWFWGRGRGQERSQGAKAKNWGKGHGKAANTFIYLRIYFLI